MSRSFKILFSFDDGLIGDLKVARILSDYGFKATFYVPSCPIRGTTPASMKEIYENIVLKGHEIGGHTVSHPMDIKLLNDSDLKFEIENNKQYCEIGLKQTPCTKFCYPRGRHDERVREAVKKAGYLEARTSRVLQITNDRNDPYQVPTTIHMFPRKEYNGEHWTKIGRRMFEKAVTEGDFFHLWGHSNELESLNMWQDFEDFLKFLTTYSHGANGANVI